MSEYRLFRVILVTSFLGDNMSDQLDRPRDEDYESSLHRREFLRALGKWSCVVIGAVSVGPARGFGSPSKPRRSRQSVRNDRSRNLGPERMHPNSWPRKAASIKAVTRRSSTKRNKRRDTNIKKSTRRTTNLGRNTRRRKNITSTKDIESITTHGATPGERGRIPVVLGATPVVGGAMPVGLGPIGEQAGATPLVESGATGESVGFGAMAETVGSGATGVFRMATNFHACKTSYGPATL